MRKKLHAKAKAIANDPRLRNSVTQMKPKKTVWEFLGVVLFFIVPEIVAFIWGAQITHYAHAQMLNTSSPLLTTWYEALVMLFEDGGSWVNLGIGIALLVWFFF